jgi:hypothetical protein
VLEKRVDAIFDIYGKHILHFMTEKEACNRIVFAKNKNLYFILKDKSSDNIILFVRRF